MIFIKNFKSFNLTYLALFCVLECFVCTVTRTKFEKIDINNIVVGDRYIYLGGVNRVVSLDEKFNIVKSYETGPHLDTPKCLPIYKKTTVCSDNITKPTKRNSYNKILLLVKTPFPMLVACGSLFYGICDFLDPVSLKEIPAIYNNTIIAKRIYLPSAVAAANNDDASTVSFITNDISSLDTLLITAKTKTYKHPTVSELATISAIPLGVGTGNSFEQSFLKENEKFSLKHDRKFYDRADKLTINFKFAFSKNDFAYFFMSKTSSSSNKNFFHPFVGRLQIKKDALVDYIEVKLNCKTNWHNYDMLISVSQIKIKENKHVIYTLFSNSVSSLGAKFAICEFKLKDIDDHVSKTITNCSSKNTKFVEWATENQRDGCLGERKMLIANTPLQGKVLHKTSEEMFALFGFPHKRGTTLYATCRGFKVKMFNVLTNELYEFNKHNDSNTGDSDGHYENVVLGRNGEQLLLTSKNYVGKMLIENCTSRKSCEDCLSGPGCGWCTLENKCCSAAECRSNDKLNYFINESTENCPRIENLQPNRSSILERKEISFDIKNTPLDVTYRCSLNNLIIGGTLNGSSFKCDSTNFTIIPNVKDLNGVASLKVKLIVANTGSEVVSSEIELFVCNSFNMCKSCITAVFPCGWCGSTLKCVDMPNMQCPNSQQRIPYQGIRSTTHESLCPRITPISNIYLPTNIEKDFQLVGERLPAESTNDKYECELEIEGYVQKTPATFSNETRITCKSKKFSFTANASLYVAKLSVVFGTSRIDTGDLNVTLIKCNYKRNDCSTCNVAPAEWGCTWCAKNRLCSAVEECAEESLNLKCPEPVITKVFPSEVPLGGGTNVTIEGTDLGLKVDDIESVKLADISCNVSKSQEKLSSRIVCKTNAQTTEKKGTVVVFVKSGNGVRKSSTNVSFYYRNPTISDFSPKQGPCSGGTLLKIKGKYLNVGNKVSVFLGKLECAIEEKASNQILCYTPFRKKCTPSSQRRRRKRRQAADSVGFQLTIFFDNNYKILYDETKKFNYSTDPLIRSMYTSKKLISLKTFKSGGQLVYVDGKNFHLIEKPKMFVIVPGWNDKPESLCEQSENGLLCTFPNISALVLSAPNKFVKVNVGFKLDGVKTYNTDYREFEVYPDPIFYPFNGGIYEVTTNDLILTGSGFEVITKQDLRVTVAGLNCNIIDFDKRLVCKLPSEGELAKASPDPGRFDVKVYLGQRNYSYSLGSIRFFKAKIEEKSWMVYVIPSIVGLIILIIIILVLFLMYRRKNKKEKEYQQMIQVQMDQMEMNIAKGCKEAFAAYQTELTDLSEVGDLVSPYLDFPQYAIRVLYPGMTTHPIMEANRDSRLEWEASMRALINLLKEKDFALSFIRSLECQGSFAMTDRCTVASLLMVSLQDDLCYVTELLKELLNDLIHKAKSGKRLKLLLRRTESVAEKLLTIWLAYTLHDFLKTTVGEPLFKLFSAMDILLEKEPIDAITFDAKNSLSEDKLIRQIIEFKSMSINIEYVSEDDTKTFTEIPVLTCDTISQTKEKIIKFIYKNKPSSSWPLVEDLCLVFPSANGTVLSLRDEDGSNIVQGEWKKINTLEHYKVPDKANLRIGPMSVVNPNESFDIGSDFQPAFVMSPPRVRKSSLKKRILSLSLRSMQDIGKSETGLCNNTSMLSVSIIQPGLSSTSTPMLHHTDRSELKLWHIVKQQDYPEEQKEENRRNKMMAEVFLTRLLKTKDTLQPFVNNLFDAIFGLSEGERIIPPSINYLFNFLDDQARDIEVDDIEVRHTWKNNSLPLRFWINMIKNPNFIFDVKKSNTVDSCLSVIAQLFMDSCSPDDRVLGKDSPSNKLLYAKEIPDYKKKVKRFYTDVEENQLNEEKFFNYLNSISEQYGNSFNSCNAARELMSYAVKYKVKVMEDLETNGFENFADALQTIMVEMPDD